MTTASALPTITVLALPSGEPHPAASPVRRVVADGSGSYPCRRCLRDAQVGDELLLLPYDPFPAPSPYAGEGPIYVHADGCPPYEDDGSVPGFVTRRVSMSVRAYDADGMLCDCDVMTGAEVEDRARAMLAAGAAFVHVHNAKPGCFMCTIAAALI
jgi:hypothetical protein